MVCESLMASQRNKSGTKPGKGGSGTPGVPGINLEVISTEQGADDEAFTSPVKATSNKGGGASQKLKVNHSNYTMEDNDESDGEYSAEKEGPGKLGAVSLSVLYRQRTCSRVF